MQHQQFVAGRLQKSDPQRIDVGPLLADRPAAGIEAADSSRSVSKPKYKASVRAAVRAMLIAPRDRASACSSRR